MKATPRTHRVWGIRSMMMLKAGVREDHEMMRAGAVADAGVEYGIDGVDGLGDEHQLHPLGPLHQEGFAEAEGFSDLITYFGRDVERELGGGITGSQLEQAKDEEADHDQRRYGEQSPPHDVSAHLLPARVLETREPSGLGPKGSLGH